MSVSSKTEQWNGHTYAELSMCRCVAARMACPAPGDGFFEMSILTPYQYRPMMFGALAAVYTAAAGLILAGAAAAEAPRNDGRAAQNYDKATISVGQAAANVGTTVSSASTAARTRFSFTGRFRCQPTAAESLRDRSRDATVPLGPPEPPVRIGAHIPEATDNHVEVPSYRDLASPPDKAGSEQAVAGRATTAGERRSAVTSTGSIGPSEAVETAFPKASRSSLGRQEMPGSIDSSDTGAARKQPPANEVAAVRKPADSLPRSRSPSVTRASVANTGPPLPTVYDRPEKSVDGAPNPASRSTEKMRVPKTRSKPREPR